MTELLEKKRVKPKLPKHDGLFKSSVSDLIIARDCMELMLPEEIKSCIDLNTLEVEQETFISPRLQPRASDVIYSVKHKTEDYIYSYIIFEHQSSPKKSMALRLEEYKRLLLERHKQTYGLETPLPLVYQIVLYNGLKKYNVPRTVAEMSVDPPMAVKIAIEGARLVNLSQTSDQDFLLQGKIGMFFYAMKYIKVKDSLELLQEILTNFRDELTKDNQLLYIEKILCYLESNTIDERQGRLSEILEKYLFEIKNSEKNMRSIAQAKFEAGWDACEEKGKIIWLNQGREEGREEGIEQGIVNTAVGMLKASIPVDVVSRITGLSIKKLMELRDNIS